MRVFVKIKEMLASHKDLTHKIEGLERKLGEHDKKIVLIFDTIKQMMSEAEAQGGYRRTKIGFIVDRPTPV